MYDFYDYFNSDNKKQPYLKPGEELEDYLRLLDMLLENYLEYKGMGSQKKLFSRGLVITESELVSYFEMPPYYRERDICNPALAAEADAAFSYIEERVAATREYISESLAATSKSAEDSRTAEKKLIRLSCLKDIFSLSKTELMAILLALAPEIDRRYERIFGFFQDNVSQGTPTLGLLHTLMARITPREGSEDTIPMPLDEKLYIYFLTRKDDQTGLTSQLILQPTAKKFLTGALDQAETNSDVFYQFEESKNTPVFFTESAKEIEYILTKEKSAVSPTTLTEKLSARSSLSDRTIYLAAGDEETALHLLYQNCIQHNESLYVMDLGQLFSQNEESQQLSLSDLFLRLKLYNGRLAIRLIPEESNDMAKLSEQRLKIKNMLKTILFACAPNTIFLFGEKEEPGELAAMLIPSLKIPDPSVALRTDMWNYFLNSEKGIKLSKNVNIPDLADFYEISYSEIKQAVGHTAATSRAKRGTTINRKMILESLRQLNQVDFSGLATYINPVYTWKDITITEHQRAILQTACDRCRLRNRIGEGWGLKAKNAYGNGISLLLYGPPGTGKTMAAQVVANELELPLYRVDISQISSKYIGETEKNLATIFKAAATANVILFFDEADSLFSKRTEVSDSHDKYANNETAFLLQKIEEYNGMSILATNYYNNFDDAFVRRITYAVHMESPDKDTRYALWTSILPKTAKTVRNIDYRFLADKFELSGSNIKAILYNAAYMAGAEDKPIGPEHIVRSMQYEFTKLGKLVNGSDFGKYAVYLK